MSKVFFDTNILVYQIDNRNLKKRAICRDLFKESASKGEAAVSTQVLQEFYVTATVKLLVNPLLAKSLLRIMENLEVVTVGKDLINEAVDVSLLHKISFWDSLIVVAAESAACELLYSEDLNAGQVIRNVRVVNPFM